MLQYDDRLKEARDAVKRSSTAGPYTQRPATDAHPPDHGRDLAAAVADHGLRMVASAKEAFGAAARATHAYIAQAGT